MSVPKNRRRKSSADFEMIYFRLVDGVDELIAHDFFAEGGLAERNRTFLNIRCESLQRFTDDLLYYIQMANSIYPQCEAELNERRLAGEPPHGCGWHLEECRTCGFEELLFNKLTLGVNSL